MIDRRACSFRRHQQPRQRILAVEIGKPALLPELAAAHDQHPVEIAGETGLAPARVDGLLALKGVIVQEENFGGDAPTRAALPPRRTT